MTGGFLGCPIAATPVRQLLHRGPPGGGQLHRLNMASWIGGDTQFTLQGRPTADRLDAHRVATTLKNGVWTGTWTDGGSTTATPFPGTFTGVRK